MPLLNCLLVFLWLHLVLPRGGGKERLDVGMLLAKEVMQVACPNRPHPKAPYVAASTASEPSDAPHRLACWSSRHWHLPMRAGYLPHCYPGLATCWPSASPPPGAVRERQASEGCAGRWPCSALLGPIGEQGGCPTLSWQQMGAVSNWCTCPDTSLPLAPGGPNTKAGPRYGLICLIYFNILLL